ncbi:MAG: DUF6456 domain-containing protein [Bdellovibrionales bacterium]
MKQRRRPVSTDRRLKQNRSLSGYGEQDFIPDHGPAERWQHAGRTWAAFGQADGHTRALTARVVEESVLDILHLQGQITRQHLEAALRFKADFVAADLGAHLVAAYHPVHGGRDFFSSGSHDRSDGQEKAYRRWRGAMVEMGDLLNDCVVDVVCHDIPPSQRYLLLLQMGLIKLSKYYKIPKLDDDVNKAAAREVRTGGLVRGDVDLPGRLVH